jgi:hypothetical protein
MSQNRMTEHALCAMLKSGSVLRRLHVCWPPSSRTSRMEFAVWHIVASLCNLMCSDSREGLRMDEEAEVLAKSNRSSALRKGNI